MIQLSTEVIEENFKTFLNLLEPVVKSRDGSDWEGLKEKLINSDFKIAPASTKYHGSYAGGLCDHSLNVYYNLVSLVRNKHLDHIILPDSLTIVSLLHDFSKINYYEPSYRNKKVYYAAGSKKDELGNYDWVSEKSYALKPETERFLYGNHEENSEFMIRQYIPLTYIESTAILNHHMGMAYDSKQSDVAMRAATKYPLVALLHTADFISSTVDENPSEE